MNIDATYGSERRMWARAAMVACGGTVWPLVSSVVQEQATV